MDPRLGEGENIKRKGVPTRIFPLLKPPLLILHHAPSRRIASGNVRIRPHALHNLVFIRSSKHFRDIGEESIYFIWGVDDNPGVCHGEADGYVTAVGST